MQPVKKRPHTINAPRTRQFDPRIWGLLALVAAIGVYSIIAYTGRFVQDDAYISYRYVANYLNGHGLVWNIGERVEGFTNLGWVSLLILVGRLGGDIIELSRIIGFLCGAGILIVTWLLARHVLRQFPQWTVILAVMLVGTNGALAYWAAAGLETAAFALLAMLSLYFYVTGNWLLVWSLLLAVWFRPDGAVVAALLVITETIVERKLPRFTLVAGACALVLSVPMLAFKLSYYGSILPNSFYAKTGSDVTQALFGLGYAWEFARHYGFLGIAVGVTALLYRSLTSSQRTLMIFLIGYTLYIIAVGGDVLKVHRFFIPLIGVSAIVTSLALARLAERLSSALRIAIATLALLILPALTWWIARPTIGTFLANERALVEKMEHKANALQRIDSSPFSVAATTIGALGYGLMGHRVIDMLGLTDSVIARHPEELPAGITSTWKERSLNTAYLLSQAPDYVAFSTGFRPSAPAEKALFLYRQWLLSYRIVACELNYIPQLQTYEPISVFRRVRPVDPPFVQVNSVEFVDKFSSAVRSAVLSNPDSALSQLAEARRLLKGEVYSELLYLEARAIGQKGQRETQFAMLDDILKADSLVIGAHRDLYLKELAVGNSGKAAIHRRYLEKFGPEELRIADDFRRRQGQPPTTMR